MYDRAYLWLSFMICKIWNYSNIHLIMRPKTDSRSPKFGPYLNNFSSTIFPHRTCIITLTTFEYCPISHAFVTVVHEWPNSCWSDIDLWIWIFQRSNVFSCFKPFLWRGGLLGQLLRASSFPRDISAWRNTLGWFFPHATEKRWKATYTKGPRSRRGANFVLAQ